MSKVIIVNGITLDNANIVPLTKKIKKWSGVGIGVYLIGTKKLFSSVAAVDDNLKYKKILVTNLVKSDDIFSFYANGLTKNIQALKIRSSYLASNPTIYTISSVLELIVYPYIQKTFFKNVKWVTVFDNTVSLTYLSILGFINSIIATAMFQISLVLLKKADTIFVISSDLKDYLINKGFDHKKIVTSQNGIELNELNSSSYSKKLKTSAVYVGRINPEKGIYDILEVLKLVVKVRPDFKMGIVGIGDKKSTDQYLDAANKAGLGKNIVFFGKRYGVDKFNILKSSQCFLFLSHHESYGVALQEALLSGLPAVVYNLPVYTNHHNQSLINRVSVGDFNEAAKKVLALQGTKKNISSVLSNKAVSWENIAKLEQKYF